MGKGEGVEMERRGARLEMGRTGGNWKGREMGGGGQHSAIVQFESLVQQFISASDISTGFRSLMALGTMTSNREACLATKIHTGGHETVASHFCKIESTAHSYH